MAKKHRYIYDDAGNQHLETYYDSDDLNRSGSDFSGSSGYDSEYPEESKEEEDPKEGLASDSESTVDSDEEELSVAPKKQQHKPKEKAKRAKLPTNKEKARTSTPKLTSSTAKTPTNAKKSTRKDPKHVTPPEEVDVENPEDISPISAQLHSSKTQRRSASVSTMASSAGRRSREKEEHNKNKRSRSGHDTDDDNDGDQGAEKDRMLRKLSKKNKELQEKMKEIEQANKVAELPVPKCRPSSKKKRRSKKEKGSKRGVTMDDFVKKLSKEQFRHTKFVRTEEQFRVRVGNLVMNELELDGIHHKEDETEAEAKQVEANRDAFYAEWSGIMATGWNEVRNYRQGRVKDAFISWMVDNKSTTLFPTKDLEIVMKRDFSKWEPKIDEKTGEKVTKGNPKKLEYYHSLFDFYVDKCLPAVAGAQDFRANVRHFVPVSQARYPDSVAGVGGKLIINPGMEALVLFFFINARKKWEMMYDWQYVKGYTDRKKNPFPKWSPLQPLVNVEWKTVYSNSASGQDPLNGWRKAGIKEYNHILGKMMEVRKDQDLCLFEEKLAVQRLYEANKEHYEKINANKPAAVEEDDGDDDDEMIFDDPDM